MSAFFKKSVLVAALFLAVLCCSVSWSQAGERYHGPRPGRPHYGHYHPGPYRPAIHIHVAPVQPFYGPIPTKWGRRYIGPPIWILPEGVPHCHGHGPVYW